MKIQIFIIALLVGLVGVAATNAPTVAPVSLCDDSGDTVVRNVERRSSAEIYRSEICRVGGVVTFTDWVGGSLNHSRAATNYEQLTFQLKSVSDLRDATNARLRNAAAVLRTWESQAAQTGVDWDGLTASQKDSRLKILIERSGVFYGHFADLLTQQGLTE